MVYETSRPETPDPFMTIPKKLLSLVNPSFSTVTSSPELNELVQSLQTLVIKKEQIEISNE